MYGARNLRYTGTIRTPAEAMAPNCSALRRAPAFTTTSPSCRMEPRWGDALLADEVWLAHELQAAVVEQLDTLDAHDTIELVGEAVAHVGAHIVLSKHTVACVRRAVGKHGRLQAHGFHRCLAAHGHGVARDDVLDKNTASCLLRRDTLDLELGRLYGGGQLGHELLARHALMKIRYRSAAPFSLHRFALARICAHGAPQLAGIHSYHTPLATEKPLQLSQNNPYFPSPTKSEGSVGDAQKTILDPHNVWDR